MYPGDTILTLFQVGEIPLFTILIRHANYLAFFGGRCVHLSTSEWAEKIVLHMAVREIKIRIYLKSARFLGFSGF
jgi:hypothetical protein